MEKYRLVDGVLWVSDTQVSTLIIGTQREEVADATALALCTNLSYLHLATTVTPCLPPCLPSIKELVLDFKTPIHTSMLEVFPNLESLTLIFTRVADPLRLSNFPRLLQIDSFPYDLLNDGLKHSAFRKTDKGRWLRESRQTA